MPGRGWVVLKFGGTSVASVRGWESVEVAVRDVLAAGRRAMVVCSAVAGVSDALEAAARRAVAGEPFAPTVDALREQHGRLCASLGVRTPAGVAALLEDLGAALEGLRSGGDDPRIVAAVLAAGERWSALVGVDWLASRGLHAAGVDARHLLVAVPDLDPRRRWLGATVRPSDDLGALARVAAPVVVTQGFLASDGEGGTALLGRGGSDTSAARIGALLRATRVEIWTDVPGMFSADPVRIPAARPLPHLSYDEAEALASLGARVLHPRAVAPVREARIPLLVRSTFDPGATGTRIDASVASTGVRGVTERRGLLLVRVRRPSRWQPVGFLADVAACFARHGLSMDLVATSPDEVVATLDPASLPGVRVEPLLADLARQGAVTSVGRVASASVVGTALRAWPGALASAFAAVGSTRVHLVVHGASDHHLTFVVDEADAPPLVVRLHAALVVPTLGFESASREVAS